MAELYDRFRPGYPAALARDVAELSGLPECGRILELGCGTGQATELFAARGYCITALEPGPQMARLARRNLQQYSNVRVVESTFESWEPDGEPFDLVLAASSFHLLEPAHRFSKPAHILGPRGALALVWNQPTPRATELDDEVESAYRMHAPDIEYANDVLNDQLGQLIDGTGLFGSVSTRDYMLHRVYREEEYLGLMQSRSSHRLLPPEQHSALFQAVSESIRRFGGEIEVDFAVWLYVMNVVNGGER